MSSWIATRHYRNAFALTPYFKEELPEAQALLQQLRQLDSLLGGEAHD